MEVQNTTTGERISLKSLNARGETYTPAPSAHCAFCGLLCTGDTTDDETAAPVCDDPNQCPGLLI